MLTVAYLANQFPSAVEPYVSQEIEELRRRGIRVIAGSVRTAEAHHDGPQIGPGHSSILCLQPIRVLILLRALGLVIRRWRSVASPVSRVLFDGQEAFQRRLKALLHTWLGAYYAVLLEKRGVQHIHVHHGYFGSWIAMIAARLLGIGYSLTLHGSDLLVNGSYVDEKLKNCGFCITVSGYNRGYMLARFPQVDPLQIIVTRLGVEIPERAKSRRRARSENNALSLLAVGRLHAVKDHAFLVRACAQLRDEGIDFTCVIAGEGPERRRLEELIRVNQLRSRVQLVGHADRAQIASLYLDADVIVLTSRSEGLPLVLMEAMAGGGIVLAPAITGIPELVLAGKTGFLYSDGNVGDFVARIRFLHERLLAERFYASGRLDWIRHAALLQVRHNFNRSKNLKQFCDQFLHMIDPHDFATQDQDQDRSSREDFVLQQI